MAKGKHAVALFEVIQRDKRFQRRGTPGAHAPGGPAAQGLPPGSSPTGAPSDDPKLRLAASEAPVVDSAASCDAARNVNATIQSRAGASIQSSAIRLQSAGLTPIARRPRPRREPLQQRFSFDDSLAALKDRLRSASDRIREFAVASMERLKGLQIQWMPAATAGALILSATGAILLARHERNIRSAHSAAPAPLNVASEVPHPSVLDVSSQVPTANPETAQSPELAADVQAASSSQPGSTVAQPGNRVVNMHYVLIQSYLDEKTADAARDLLCKSGIACTIEQGIKGWRKSFFQVIGLQGFVHPSGAEYSAYLDRIETVSEAFSPKRHSYKRFDPMAIKWTPVVVK